MSLDETLQRKLADWRPPDGRHTLTVEHDGWAVAVTADRVDSVGCQLWEVAVSRPSVPLTADLKARGEQLAGRITVLLGPLRLCEVDTTRGTAQLRSESPRQRGEQRSYFELLLQADGAASLRRYQVDAASPRREQAAFPLTHEALAHLAADLTAPA
jgi:hypothetical protein